MFVQLLLGLQLLVTQDLRNEEQPKKKFWMNNFAQNLYLETFNASTRFFCPEADLDSYGRLILKLKSLTELSTWEHKAILAFILLFHPGANDPETTASELNDTFSYYIRISDDCLNLPNLINILSGMVNFCTDNIEWNNYDEISQPSQTVNIY